MKNFVLKLGRSMLDTTVFLFFIGIIFVAVYFIMNDYAYLGFITLISGFTGIVVVCFMLYLMIDLDDNIKETRDILVNTSFLIHDIYELLVVMKDNSNSVNIMLSNTSDLFNEMKDSTSNINKVLSEYVRDRSNVSYKKVFLVKKENGQKNTDIQKNYHKEEEEKAVL